MNKVYFKHIIIICIVLGIAVFPRYAEANGQSRFTCSDWLKLDYNAKLNVMREFIAAAKRDNVILQLPAEYYVKEIDSIINTAIEKNDKNGLATSVGIVIHTIAAMEGDWGNGEDKLAHAQKWLGSDFDYFKTTFPNKYERLLKEKANNKSEKAQQNFPADRD